MEPENVLDDGEDVTVFNETNFWGGAGIQPGSNTISIVARDAAGRQDASLRQVTFPL